MSQQARSATYANVLKEAVDEVMIMFPQSIGNNIKALRSSFKVPHTFIRL